MTRACVCLWSRGGRDLPSASAQYTIKGDSGERVKQVCIPYLKRGAMRKPCNYDTVHIGEVLGETEV